MLPSHKCRRYICGGGKWLYSRKDIHRRRQGHTHDARTHGCQATAALERSSNLAALRANPIGPITITKNTKTVEPGNPAART
jgi:hypothetical protein